MKIPLLSLASLAITLAVAVASPAAVPDRVDFNFHVKPILSDRCYHCHGPDHGNRQADLRLDTKDGLFAAVASSDASHVVKPGDLDHSEMARRVSATDEDVRMPPPDSKLSLTAEEIAIIRRWIEQGAEWKQHWSFLPVQAASVPESSAGIGPATKSTASCWLDWKPKDLRRRRRPAASG